MIGAHTAAGRGRIGFLGFVPSVEPANVPRPPSGDPDDGLARCLALLMQATGEFSDLPDDDPAQPAIIAWIDVLLGQAAVLRPVTDRGFAVKARIARVYGDCAAGERVHLWLLSDLMIRGRA